MITHKPGATAPRRLTCVALLLLAAVLLAAAGCGGDDTPAVCGSLETLGDDVQELRDKDLEAGEAAVAEVEASLDTIRSDLESVKTEAEAELSEPIAGLESSLAALAADVEAVRAAGDISEDTAQELGDSAAAVSQSWETLKTSAPDCDL